MKHTFEELYNFQLHNQKEAPWCQDETMAERAEELRGEIDELLKEIEAQNVEEMKDEMGDVLWDTLALLAKAENKKLFTAKEVMEHTLQKFKRRKPFLLTGEKITKEQENKIWEEIKEQERNEKRHKTTQTV